MKARPRARESGFTCAYTNNVTRMLLLRGDEQRCDRSCGILLIDTRRPRLWTPPGSEIASFEPICLALSSRHSREKKRNSRRIAVSCLTHLAAPFFVTQYTRFVFLHLLLLYLLFNLFISFCYIFLFFLFFGPSSAYA